MKETGLVSIPLWVFAWILLIVGILTFLILLIYAKYGREMSIKFSIITILITSSSLAFAIHFFLLNLGL
ncbi:MAG: hypothetical protein GF311_06265 [Candidatus Lokiarchaeota archaeon]|nr:hypothetical protein [Candidatus Lokiarchaeota archaeon]